MKAVFGVIQLLLLLFTVAFAVNTPPVTSQFSGTIYIYIRSDGSVDPSAAPIQRVEDIYTLSDNIVGNITIQKDNVVVDGVGHTVEGTEINFSTTSVTIGVDLSHRSNVTIKNMRIRSFINGIRLLNSSKNSIIGNNITENVDGIRLDSSANNAIISNNITVNHHGIHPFLNNKFYHNNLINNTYHVYLRPEDSVNTWDNGSEGNYWDNYNGTDSDGDGIGDTPYTIDSNNTDRYPLMSPYVNQSQDLQLEQTFWLYLIIGLVAITTVIAIGLLLFKGEN